MPFVQARRICPMAEFIVYAKCGRKRLQHPIISETLRLWKSVMAAYAASRKRFEIELIGFRTTWKVKVSDGVDSAQGKKNDDANMLSNSGYYFDRRAHQQM